MAKDLIKKEAQLGEYGKAEASLDSELKLKVSVVAQVDLIAEVEKMAAATETKVDDQAIAWLKGLVSSYNLIQG